MKLLILAIAVGLALHTDYATAAPMGLIVVTSGPRVMTPVLPSGPFIPYHPPPFIPHDKTLESEISPWQDLTMPFPHMGSVPQIKGAPRKGGCGRGRRTSLAHSFLSIMNKLRTAIGLPAIHHNHKPEWGNGVRYRLKVNQDGSRVIEEIGTQSFFTRFEYAMRSLSRWESWAVTFVLGCGLGALLRMFVVLAIILVRGHRRGRQCLIERCRRDGGAEVPVPTSMEAAPPAYTDRVDEKPHVSSAVESPASAAIQKEPGDDVQEIETVEKSDCGTLMVHWIHVDGSDRVNPASEIHEMCPGKLLSFYEANLKWRRDDEGTGAE